MLDGRGKRSKGGPGILALFMALTMVMFIPSSSDVAEAGEWTIDDIDIDTNIGVHTSIALDSSDNPHICYVDWDNKVLKYARWNGTGWVVETVYEENDVGDFISMVLDEDDHAHISFWVLPARHIWYAHWDGSEWVTEVVDSLGELGGDNSLDLDSDGIPHIAYRNTTGRCLNYAKKVDGAWETEVVDSGNDLGRYVSLRMDGEDNPHISYYDNTTNDVKYARWDGPSWRIETVDTENDVGYEISLVLDSADNPHMVYADQSEHTIKYARWTGVAWVIQTINIPYGSFPSIALDEDDEPHICGHDENERDLLYATWTGATWSIETLDSAGNVGAGPSIALEGFQNPVISYVDLDNFTLRCLWQPEQPHLSYDPGLLDYGPVVVDVIATKTIEVWNSGTGLLTYRFVPEEPAIVEMEPSDGISGGERDVVYISINTTGLPLGLRSTTVTMLTNVGTGIIDIEFNVTPPLFPEPSVDPVALDLGEVTSGPDLDGSFAIVNVGTGTFSYTISTEATWIGDLTPSAGTVGDQAVTVTFDVQTLGMTVGPHSATILVTTDAGNVEIPLSITVSRNLPPQVEQPPTTSEILLGADLNYQVVATDVEGQDLSYELVSGPGGMVIDGSTGTITWTPSASDVGTYTVHVRVSDPWGGYRDVAFDVTVTEEEPAGPALPVSDEVAVAAIATGAILIGLAVMVTTTEFGKYAFFAAIMPLYVKLAKKEVLDNKTRYALQGVIIEHPGIHYQELCRELDLPNGTAVYHLSVLEREGYVRSVRDGKLKRYYSANTKVPDHRPSPEELREGIMYLLYRRPGMSQKEISEELGLDRNTVGYHLRDMVEKRQLRSARRGKFTVYFPRDHKPT